MLFRKISVLFAVVSMTSFVANAQGRQAYRNTQSVSSSDVAHRNYVSGALGFLAPGANTLVGTSNNQTVGTSFKASGLIGIGGDYDYMLNKDFSVGGVLRYYSSTATVAAGGNTTVTEQDTLFTVGPTAHAYLPTGDFVPYLGAGLVLMAPSVTSGGNSISITSGMGLMLSMGLLYNVTDAVALGIETVRLTGLSSSINGNLIEDFMLKGRFAIAN
jgi:outer membrane protein W